MVPDYLSVSFDLANAQNIPVLWNIKHDLQHQTLIWNECCRKHIEIHAC